MASLIEKNDLDMEKNDKPMGNKHRDTTSWKDRLISIVGDAE
jgi:hypothetical protein